MLSANRTCADFALHRRFAGGRCNPHESPRVWWSALRSLACADPDRCASAPSPQAALERDDNPEQAQPGAYMGSPARAPCRTSLKLVLARRMEQTVGSSREI